MTILHAKEDGAFWIEKVTLQTKPPDTVLPANKDIKDIILAVMRNTDKKKPVAEIARQNNTSEELASQICHLYLTHPGVSADGILNKMNPD